MNRPIPVTIATGQLGLGGGERQLYLVLRELDRCAFSPTVVSFNPGRGDHWEAPIRELGIPLHEIEQSRNKAARVRRFLGLLRRSETRILHSWDLPLNATVALCARLAGIPARIGGLRRNLYKPGRRRSFQRWTGTTGLDRFVVNSTRGRVDLERFGVPTGKIDVVSNAVEPPAQAMTPANRLATRRAWGVERNEEVVIANVSNLIAVKNHALLIEATARLLKLGLPVRTVIFGDGPLRDELRRKSESPALGGRVVWAGRDPRAAELIEAADVFCFTSRSEGCPNVLLEAGAVGLPCVTTDVGGARDIVIHGETGAIVPSDDAMALVERLERLVNDPAARSGMGRAARARVAGEFTPRRTAGAIQRVYERVLGVAGSAAGTLDPREASP